MEKKVADMIKSNKRAKKSLFLSKLVDDLKCCCISQQLDRNELVLQNSQRNFSKN